MGLIQHGEAVYFPKLLEEKNMSHIKFSTTQTAGVQFEAGKRSGKGVKSSGGWQSRRKGRIDMELPKSVLHEPCTFYDYTVISVVVLYVHVLQVYLDTFGFVCVS